MLDYIIKGSVKNSSGSPVTGVKIQAMDSDQEWYEDRNDDNLGSVWVNENGVFEIPFNKELFQDGWLEGNPDIYLLVRNPLGKVVYKTEIRRGVKPSDRERLTFNIILDSLEEKVPYLDDPYSHNIDRVIASFTGIGESTELIPPDTLRVLGLLTKSVSSWILYMRQETWAYIGYDGPQVPRYPWDAPHTHKLEWER